MVTFDSITNRGEYLAAHYFAERLDADLKKQIFDAWTLREGDEFDPRPTPRKLLPKLRADFIGEEIRGYFVGRQRIADEEGQDRAYTYGDPGWGKELRSWHGRLLETLGFTSSGSDTADGAWADQEITVNRSGREHVVRVAYARDDVIALHCGWATDVDAAVDASGPGRLLDPLRVSAAESYETGSALAGWLFHSQLADTGRPPRFILLLVGGVIVLADRAAWGEGRYLAANLDVALERKDDRQTGELAAIAALFSRDMLTTRDNAEGTPLDVLLKASAENAVGVSGELRHGLQRSVELIAGEILARLDDAGVRPEDVEQPGIPISREITRESLRYLYRILFLLYAEARPELGILPSDDGSYEAGYSVARLRELVDREEELPLDGPSGGGFHLYDSLDLLFRMVNDGHRPMGTEPGDDLPGDDEETRKEKARLRSEDRGLRFEPLRSALFEPGAIRLIGRSVPDPRDDEDSSGDGSDSVLDLRLRNSTLHEVLRLLTKKRGKAGERGGFISYRNLGINQLGSVYEGLMSYTGFIANETLYEVAKKGDPSDGSWLIPASRRDQYEDGVFVQYGEDDNRKGLRGDKRYEPGSFVYRLAGRDRQTSASYYTPESLTKVTVELALKYRLDQEKDENGDPIRTRAAELLKLKICEPALGSGAFLNEAINQVASEYLKRRQEELGQSIPTDKALAELQKAKAYIALHNAYGVDLNATGVELAEVSLWLNTMHPGMQAPWFGLHLRRGNSLIGGRRAVYAGSDVISKDKAWLKAKGTLPPTELPFLKDNTWQKLPEGSIHQFLLPAVGWAAVAGEKEAKEFAPEQSERLRAWKKSILKPPAAKARRGEKKSEYARLQAVAQRVEFLWELVVKRMEISEREIARKIDVWGADASDPEYGFLRRPEQAVPKEKVYQELFEAVDSPYWRLKTLMDTWCALWFAPVGAAALLDGTDPMYAEAHLDALPAEFGGTEPQYSTSLAEPTAPEHRPAPRIVEQTAMFALPNDQLDILAQPADDQPIIDEIEIKAKTAGSRPRKPARTSRRSIIPLNEFSDWLDFAESVVGTQDAERGEAAELFGELNTLEKLGAYEAWLVEAMDMDQSAVLPTRYPWLDVVREIADDQGFLHWELDFALTFARNGGFDLQVGNPPWVRPTWDEASVLAEFDPWFKLAEKPPAADKASHRQSLLIHVGVFDYLLKERTNTSGLSEFLSSAITYELLSGTQADLYRAFMCKTWANSMICGVVGLLHPDTHFSGTREDSLRRESYKRLRIHADFVNPGHRFFPEPVGESSHFGVHIYGSKGEISFDHLSWLFAVDVLRNSQNHDGVGDAPGVRYRGQLDVRPHKSRIVRVNLDTLRVWQKVAGDNGPTDSARLLSPVSTAEAQAIQALAKYSVRLAQFDPQISSGLHERGAKESGLIDYNYCSPGQWNEVILKGPQLGVATPFFKEPNAGSNDVLGMNLTRMSDDAVPSTGYRRVPDREVFAAAHDRWMAVGSGAPRQPGSPQEVISANEFFRLAWRRQIAPDTERSLYAAIIPPGPTHINTIHSLAARDERSTVIAAGFWAALPVDYLVRTRGISDLQPTLARTMPMGHANHPLASALLLRTLRLNCLTKAYSPLWERLYDATWRGYEDWAADWPSLAPLGTPTDLWEYETPLRTEQSRRAALIELDALVSVWLGVDANALIAMYRARFPVLNRFEAVTWFDASGSKLAGNARTVGQHQKKESYAQLSAYLERPDTAPVPDGYHAPFYKADREREMREAHAVFQARLDEAVAKGHWDPETHTDPRKRK